jgi:hypothetical protein
LIVRNLVPDLFEARRTDIPPTRCRPVRGEGSQKSGGRSAIGAHRRNHQLIIFDERLNNAVVELFALLVFALRGGNVEVLAGDDVVRFLDFLFKGCRLGSTACRSVLAQGQMHGRCRRIGKEATFSSSSRRLPWWSLAIKT